MPLRSCTCLSGRSGAACPGPQAQQPWRYWAEPAHALGAPHHGRSRASVTTPAAALDTADTNSTLEDDLLLDVLLPGESQRRSAPSPAAAPPVLSSKPMMPLPRPTRAAARPVEPTATTTNTTSTSSANPSQRQQQPSLALPPSRPTSVPLPSPDTISPKPQRKVAKPVSPASKFPTFSDSDEVISSAYDGLAVSVTGRDPPAPMLSYNELAREPRRVSPLLLRNAAAAFRLQRPTPVQQHVIPAIMDGEGRRRVGARGRGTAVRVSRKKLCLGARAGTPSRGLCTGGHVGGPGCARRKW